MSDEIKSYHEGLQHLDLNKMVRNLNSILANSLDKHAPEKTKTILTRKKNPWFTHSLWELKRSLHQRKDHSENMEKTISGQHSKYSVTSIINALKNSRHEIISEKVTECG